MKNDRIQRFDKECAQELRVARAASFEDKQSASRALGVSITTIDAAESNPSLIPLYALSKLITEYQLTGLQVADFFELLITDGLFSKRQGKN